MCVRACVNACVCVCVRWRVCACVWKFFGPIRMPEILWELHPFLDKHLTVPTLRATGGVGFKKKPSWKMPSTPPPLPTHFPPTTTDTVRFNFLYKVLTTFPSKSLSLTVLSHSLIQSVHLSPTYMSPYRFLSFYLFTTLLHIRIYNIICISSFPYQLYHPRRNFPGFSIECIPAAAARLMREVIA